MSQHISKKPCDDATKSHDAIRTLELPSVVPTQTRMTFLAAGSGYSVHAVRFDTRSKLPAGGAWFLVVSFGGRAAADSKTWSFIDAASTPAPAKLVKIIRSVFLRVQNNAVERGTDYSGGGKQGEAAGGLIRRRKCSKRTSGGGSCCQRCWARETLKHG